MKKEAFILLMGKQGMEGKMTRKEIIILIVVIKVTGDFFACRLYKHGYHGLGDACFLFLWLPRLAPPGGKGRLPNQPLRLGWEIAFYCIGR